MILNSSLFRRFSLLFCILYLTSNFCHLPAESLDSITVPPSFQKPLADISTVTALSAMLLPGIAQAAALAEDPANTEAAIYSSLTYAGTLSLTYAATALIKELFPRTRPFPDISDDPEASFPSRHTAMAAAAASFATILSFTDSGPDTVEAITLAGSWSAAVATGVLRVASGEHFLSDVVAGALIGAGIGLLGGMLSRQLK